jgi:hypothetical protein
LEIASRLAAYYIDRASINYQRAELGQSVIPTASGINEQTDEPIYNGFFPLGVPESIKDIDRQIARAATELYQLPTATAVAAPAIDKISMNFDSLTSSLEKNAAAFDRQNEKIKKLKEGLTGNKEISRLVSAAANISAGVGGQRRQLEMDQTISRGTLRLREEGYSEGTARSLMEQELGVAQQLAQIQALRKAAESAAESPEDLAKVKDVFDAITQDVENSANAVRDFTIALDNIPTEIKLRTAVVDAKQELRDLVDTSNQVKGAATAIGNAFSQSFVDAISGSKTAKEALADFFKSVGSYFLDMAKQIIAKMITIVILNSLAKLLPSTSLTTSTGVSMSAGTATQSGFNMGSSLAGMFKANGGPVMPGNTYMVGERGPELLTMTPSGGYVTSNSASQAAMDRYSSGNTRGGSISVNYNVTEINGMKFVTEDQFRAGISQAAKQGAEGGFNRTMTSLKNSRSQRSKLGIGR